MSESLKSKTLKGAVWTGVERIANQSAHFIISLVLARLLSPTDYGTVGLLTVFLSVSNLFIDCGLGSALIRKKDRTEEDYSTVFWAHVVMAMICYCVLFLCAPAISSFYGMPILTGMLRVLGSVLIIGSFTSIQVARLTALINFKLQAKISMICCVTTGAVGILLAWRGCGAWALVGQQVFSAVLTCTLYWLITGWHPQLYFSKKSFRELFGFGSKILVASCLHTIYTNVAPLVIGRKYSASELGYYSRGDSLAAMPGGVFQGTLGRVIFPVLVSIQDDEVRLRNAYHRYLRLITSIVAPSMLLLAVVSEALIGMLIGEKWLPCVPYLRVLALAWIVDPIISVNLNILYVKGRSDIVLRLEFIKKIIAIAIVVISVQFGVLWLCVGRLFYSYIALWLNLRSCGPFLDMGFFRQMREVFPVYIVAIIAALLAFLVTLITPKPFYSSSLNYCLAFFSASFVGMGCYLLLAWKMKLDIIQEIRGLLHRLKIGK